MSKWQNLNLIKAEKKKRTATKKCFFLVEMIYYDKNSFN